MEEISKPQYGNDKQKYVLEFDVRCEDKKPVPKKTGDTTPADPKGATP